MTTNIPLEITILGCGTSAGVPMIGTGFGKCDAENPKNRRRRCSIVIESLGTKENLGTKILVDCGPDIKDQIVEFGACNFDALFITHEHADHVHGIDDLRWVCKANNLSLIHI